MDSDARYARQADLVPRTKYLKSRVTVIGVGSVGRQVAIQLVAMGLESIRLYDHDVIDESNVATQGYYEDSIGQAKVNALADTLWQINEDVDIRHLPIKFTAAQANNLEPGSVVFCCVDSIAARREIWTATKHRLALWLDARMLAEDIRVLTDCIETIDGDLPEYKSTYEATLFDPSEAEAGRCTAKSTIYTASIAAGLLVHQFSRWLRGFEPTPDLLLSLLGDALIVDPENRGQGERNCNVECRHERGPEVALQ